MNSCDPSLVSSGSPWWVNAAIYATAAGALVFVAAYARFAPWRSTVMGWHVMTFMGVILVVASLAVIATVFGTAWPFRNVVRAGAWYAVAAVIWWRIWLLIRAQHGVDIGHPDRAAGSRGT